MTQSRAPYIGRFAPSPTGALHVGSLLTAVASYCDARANNGKWLVRIEDIDPLREVPGASSDILRTLDEYGLHWDGEAVFQSHRQDVYQAAIEKLQQNKHLFYCSCSRKQLADHAVYPGTCRSQRLQPDNIPCALKAIVPKENICFDDALQGRFCLHFGIDAGDFVIKRKEGFFAYHLAVVVDDAEQGITHIVRGSDLLDSTPYHLLLQRWLQVATPHYAHLPVLTNALGQKLSKQTFARALPRERRGELLLRILGLLGQITADTLSDITWQSGVRQNIPPEEILDWAIRHWHFPAIPKKLAIEAEALQLA